MASTVDSQRVRERFDDEVTLERKLDQLARMVRESKNTVFFTGAGVSTSAGISDYRGPSGVWTKNKIDKLQRAVSLSRKEHNSKEQEELEALLAEQVAESKKAPGKVPFIDAQPTLCHMMQSTLIRRGIAHYVVTTNLDGLYRKAGLSPPEQVCFLHGDIYTERCTGAARACAHTHLLYAPVGY